MGSLQKSVEHNSEIRNVGFSFDQTKKGFLGYMQKQMKNVFGVEL